MICPRRHFDPRSDLDAPDKCYHLTGRLSVPRRATGMAIVAWETGRAQAYTLRRAMAAALGAVGVGTCEVDLFGPDEFGDPANLDDLALLDTRLQATVNYLHTRADTVHLPLLLVAGDRAAPAAIMVAARHPENLRAIVCCAGEVLRAPVDARSITVPTMLVAPSKHPELLESNEEFFWSLACVSQLAVVRGAGRLFQEPGTLLACEKVVTQWCRRQLKQEPAPVGAEWGDREAIFASRN